MCWSSSRSTPERDTSKIEYPGALPAARSQIHLAPRARRPLVLNPDVSGPEAEIPNHSTASRKSESLISSGKCHQEQ